MGWNHRIMKRTHQIGEVSEVEYGMYEVYYTEDDVPDGWSTEPINMTSEDLVGFKTLMEKYQMALDKPVLDYETGKLVEE